MRAGLAGLVLLLAMGGGVVGAPAIGVRAGDHEGFGRLVFDMQAPEGVRLTVSGRRAVLAFPDGASAGRPERLPRNVEGFETGPGSVTVTLAAQARVRRFVLDGRLVLDVLDGAVAEPGPTAGEEGWRVGAARLFRVVASGPGAEARVVGEGRAGDGTRRATGRATQRVSGRVQRPSGAVQDQVPAAAGTPLPAPTVAVQRAELPGAGAQAAPVVTAMEGGAVGLPAGGDAPAETVGGGSFSLPVDAGVGAAAFRRGGLGLVVLDRRVALPVPGWPGAAVRQGAVTTVLSVALPPGQALVLSHGPGGWTVARGAEPAEGAGSVPRPEGSGTLFPLRRPGRTVAVLDPVTGGTLLVGTVLEAGAGQGVGAGRRSPDLAVLPSWLGVAVMPQSDAVALRAVAGGVLGTGRWPEGAGGEDKRFDLPAEAAPALFNRLNSALAGAAEALPLARSRPRLAAAQAYLALGMGVEAQALLSLLAEQDPQAAADAQVTGLAGVAAVLAGRPGEAGGLDDRRLDEGPGAAEIRLWRGLRDRALGQDTAAARELGGLAELAWSYPATLRRAIWPVVAEAAGAALPPERRTPMLRAQLLARDGKVDEALAAYAALQAGPDRLAQMRASIGMAELQLASGRIGPGQAADLLEREVFAWRGDGRELANRLRAAELRMEEGAWRPALERLREAEALFPDAKADVARRKAAVLEGMLRAQGGTMSPMEVVLLAAEFGDCLPEGEPGQALAALLVDKLSALDLPARVIPVLQGLVKGAPQGPARAEFGARLAGLLLEGGDADGAAAALGASGVADLTADLGGRRAVLAARVKAAQGDVKGAVAGLAALGTPAADEARAGLLEAAKDWPGALMALESAASRVVPAEGVMGEAAEALVLREAGAAAQAGDGPALARLARSVPRMTGPRTELLRMLTAAPIGATAELGRSREELKLARAVPQRVNELR